MDTKAYIESSILELYVLGAVSEQERKEVECLSHIYPEIKAALIDLQRDLEKVSKQQALIPPPSVKSDIIQAISEVEQDSTEQREGSSNSRSISRNAVPFLYRAAAVIAVLLVVGFIGFYLNTQRTLSSTRAELESISQKNTALAEQVDRSAASLEQEKKVTEILADANTNNVRLSGTDNSPDASVQIYWNNETAEVLMKVNQLPEAPTGKQYQLWAIVDGTPLDMGVFDLATSSDSIQLLSTEVASADAFAITLEDEGGKPSPDLSQLYVIGNV